MTADERRVQLTWFCAFGRARGMVLVLGTVLSIAACKTGTYINVGVDGGGKADASARDASGTSDAVRPPKTCTSDTPSKSKGKAESCSCDRECQTGFCVDGICCTSACGETCKACNLRSSLGDCAFVPSGAQPNGPSVCSASTPSTCGLDGTCDGKGGCRKYGSGTECKAGTCDGDGVSGILTCDGKGGCNQAISQTCPPYSCDRATNRCSSNCATDAQCAAGQQCVAGRCGKSSNGAVCQTGDDCASTFCIDGVCCNIACSGPCVSCDQTGSVGHCRFIPAGLPDPACNPSDRTTCGDTGLCNGFGSCTLYPQNTVCGSSDCSGLVESTPRTCDGQGTCRESQLVDCSPFLCRNGACVQTCTSDADCEDGHQCVQQHTGVVGAGVCGKRKNGQPCSDAGECESGQCVDGVCCESSCTGSCRSCSLPGSPGQCLDVANGAPDPRNTCEDLGAASCSTNGACDGMGSCQIYPSGTECGPQSCVAGAYTPPSTCNSSGQCVASTSRACNPYACNGNSCYDVCTADKECMTGNYCVNASCGRKPLGANCTLGTDCQSGFCAQGVCCNNACNGGCKACNLPGSPGLCNPVTDGTPDPQGICVATLQTSCGTTGSCKGGACAYFAKGLNCKPALCASTSSETPVSTCDGAGTCSTPANVSCGTFICSSAACKATCASDADCVPPTTCVGNSCGLKPVGTACTTGSQCVSGFCTEGVCCDSACSDDASAGLCKSCKLAGKAGTCLPVGSGNADPKGRCVASNVSAGDCSRDGTCDGAGACRAWSTNTGCSGANCSAGALTPATTCDGKGNCPAAPAPQACFPYQCNNPPTSCRTSCTTVADCSSGEACLNGRCGTKLANGQSCADPSDCSSNQCTAEGVCCNSACTGACQSCTITGKVGTCSSISVGGDPRANTTACAKTTAACGNTGKCDGNGGCELTATCNDGNLCTQTDTCNQSEVCVGSSPVTCSPSDSCHDVGACTPSTGLCTNPAKKDGTACNDGNACTQTDNCQAGACTGSNPVVCAAADQCHTAGTCNPATGTCSNPAKPDGTSCNDGNPCTQTDTCVAGVCVGGNPKSCTASDQCHTAGTCNPATGTCSNPAKADGTACNDGNACTQTDTCVAGACVGGNPKSCAASDQCHAVGTCNPANGTCSNPAAADGTACNDGNACTQTDTCVAGACVGGSPKSCSASDQCHAAGTCDPTTGTCSNPAVDGTSCNDGNACTQTDKCVAGVCVGGNPKSCTASDQCHTAGTCNPATGTCSNPTKADGTACNDGNACTQTDTCVAGACVGGSPKSCTASDQCHTAGTCNPANGTCSNPVAADGTSCNDGNACTQTDTCVAGACVGGSPKSCTASDQCHAAGTCNPANGTCSNPAATDGTGCNDGNACTQTDTCMAGVCVGGSLKSCTASDQCHTAGTCDPGTGTCSNPAATDGTGCNDGNACTQTDTCVAGVCVGGSPKSCVAGDQCHAAGTCDPGTGTCSNPAVLNGSPCNAGNPCTTNDTCQDGTCTPGTPVACDAG